MTKSRKSRFKKREKRAAEVAASSGAGVASGLGTSLERRGGRGGAKSMAERVAAAVSVRPREYDPEDLTFTGREDDWGSGDEDEQRVGVVIRPGELDDEDGVEVGYAVDEGINDAHHRIRPDIALDDGVYAGRVVRSEALFRAPAGSDGGSVSGSDDESADESDDDDVEALRAREPELEFGYSSDGEGGDESDSLEAMEAELLELQQSSASTVRHLVDAQASEGAKARAALAQSQVFDAVLQARVALQRPLELGNKLPDPQLFSAALHALPDVADASASAAAALTDTLVLLARVEDALVAAAPALADDGDTSGVPPIELPLLDLDAGADPQDIDLDALWDQLAARQAAMQPQVDAAIERWNRKAQLAGGMQFKSLTLKTLHRPLLDQIADALDDTSNIRAASQRVRCQPDELLSSDGRYADPAAADASPAAARAPHPTSEHIYDDVDFFQKLLRQLMASSAASSAHAGASEHADPVALSRQWLERKDKLRKINAAKGAVDTRASKGRKLRYNVQPSLTNFMAPVPSAHVDEGGMALLNGLFGYSLPDPTS